MGKSVIACVRRMARDALHMNALTLAFEASNKSLRIILALLLNLDNNQDQVVY